MASDAPAVRDSTAEVNPVGAFTRTASTFRDHVRVGSTVFPPEAGRYLLYVSLACPWANSCLAARSLKGLEEALPVSVVAPVWGATKPAVDGHRGWIFDATVPGATADPVFGASSIRDVYERSTNGAGAVKFTVPVLFDTKTKAIVNNESSDILIMLNESFDALARFPDVNLRPASLVPRIEEASSHMYESVNNGVYRCGFAQSQEAYEVAFRALFEALDHYEATLTRRRFVCGDVLTEADIRLFVTLVRFDEVYTVHFKCNRNFIREFPALSAYVRDVYQYRGGAIGKTVNMEHIKQHYYGSHAKLNPYGIIPLGKPDDFSAPHGRESMPAESLVTASTVTASGSL